MPFAVTRGCFMKSVLCYADGVEFTVLGLHSKCSGHRSSSLPFDLLPRT
jgi:hypothetical protein